MPHGGLNSLDIVLFACLQVVSCNWHRRQTLAISADSAVSGYFVVEYMGFRSEKASQIPGTYCLVPFDLRHRELVFCSGGTGVTI